MTKQTYYRWRAEYDVLELDQVELLELLDLENERLRPAVADFT